MKITLSLYFMMKLRWSKSCVEKKKKKSKQYPVLTKWIWAYWYALINLSNFNGKYLVVLNDEKPTCNKILFRFLL